jgi:hypothetical protein
VPGKLACTIAAAIVLLSVCGAVPAGELADHAAESALFAVAVRNCEPLARLLDSGGASTQLSLAPPRAESRGGIEKLTDPDMEREDEIERLAADCREIVEFLSHMDPALDELPPVLESVRGLCRLYLLFTERGQRVRLATSDDPALVRLREDAALPPPLGFAFVCYFPSDALPPEIEEPFRREETRGVTIFSRYVAIRDDPAPKEKEPGRRAAQRRVVSHELVHSYVNCLLGPGHRGDLPKWFHEGCAIHFAGNQPQELLYVSQRRAGAAIQKIVETSTLPEDYRNYHLAFLYLSKLRGKEPFYRFVRETIAERSLDQTLPQHADVTSWEELLQAAKHWERIRAYRFASLVLLALLAIYTLHALHSEWYEHYRLLSAKTALLLVLLAGLIYFVVRVLPTL